MLQEHVINGRWKLSRQIGSGSFGNIFLAADMVTNEEVRAHLRVHPVSRRLAPARTDLPVAA